MLLWYQMKIRFDTTSGVDTKNWECLLTVSCTPDVETPDELLESGWLLDPITNDWYMSRSVRINLSKWSPSKSAAAAASDYQWQSIDLLSTEDEELLRSYRRERGIINYPHEHFKKSGVVTIERGESNLGNCWHMTVHYGSASTYPICAFEKSGTKTSPGKACWIRACQIAKARGSSYLYAYEGYGLANAYKASFDGFEWWDGVRWSDNKAVYLECLRDDIKR